MKKITPILLITVILTSCAAKLSADKKYQLDKQLKDMVEIDQIAANIPQGKYKDYSKQQWHNFQDSVFTTHKKTVEQMFAKYGFLGFDKVGKEGSNNFGC